MISKTRDVFYSHIFVFWRKYKKKTLMVIETRGWQLCRYVHGVGNDFAMSLFFINSATHFNSVLTLTVFRKAKVVERSTTFRPVAHPFSRIKTWNFWLPSYFDSSKKLLFNHFGGRSRWVICRGIRAIWDTTFSFLRAIFATVASLSSTLYHIPRTHSNTSLCSKTSYEY